MMIMMVVVMSSTFAVDIRCRAPRAENAKINVTDEPYFGTQIVCNYLPFSKAAKGAQGGPQQYATFERKHSPTEK